MKQSLFYDATAFNPDNHAYLKRHKLNKLLEKAVQSPLVTVVANAGYGKTQAVYSFLKSYKAVTIWLQLSRFDNLEDRFWENFIQAMAVHNKGFAAQLAEIGFPGTARQFERYVLLPRVETMASTKYIFVFDDFHLIREKSVLRFIENTLTTVSAPFPNISTVLISRTEPAINTVGLTSKGLVFRINEDDLRFSQEELRQYFELLEISLTPQA
ncbi:MAG: hypothetical protein LBH54_04340, partial [Clostridiales bacterium]|nr:hypothetical protein [Clostridiales bacterium]